MIRELHEYESLQFFRQNAQRFPKTTSCLESGKVQMCVTRGNACSEEAVDEKTKMRVICAGRQDEQNCYIICQIASVTDGLIHSFVARVEDGNGREVTRAHFVSFETNRAFARLIIPAAIFHQCGVFMEAASISENRVDVEKYGEVSLKDLYVEQIEASYQIGAPVITRKGVQADRIEITYYDRACNKANYDYVYHGRDNYDGTDQMYLDSYGSILLKDIELERADAVLTVSKGKDEYGSGYPGKKYPGQAKMEVKGNYISYQFERKWEGVSVTKCLGGFGYAMVDYLLEIECRAEGQVLGIYMDNGEELNLTAGHAVNTVDGIYPAVRLRAGQQVVTENGAGTIRQILPRCGRSYRVYHLCLEEGAKWLYAGGTMVYSEDGGELFRDRDWVREQLPEEWREDYDNAREAGLIYGE